MTKWDGRKETWLENRPRKPPKFFANALRAYCSRLTADKAAERHPHATGRHLNMGNGTLPKVKA